ncbi:MAG: winged helix DNA-binding domain-containing protein, partial [Planctomycetes bacterium]|nr:winged helix DNA-binding domain-containing protein [Planctomycetota bacterium]
RRVRPDPTRGVLLSPFDPVLWDRSRVELLFGFDQVLEIYKRAHDRVYGYYCLPVLAGERLIGRVDLEVDRARGRLRVLRRHHGERAPGRRPTAEERAAVDSAIARHATSLELVVTTRSP